MDLIKIIRLKNTKQKIKINVYTVYRIVTADINSIRGLCACCERLVIQVERYLVIGLE